MPLVDPKVAFSLVPARFPILGIREQLRGQWSAGGVFTVEVPPGARDRVVPSDIHATVETIGDLERRTLIATLETIIRVLDEAEVVHPSKIVRRLAGRRVGPQDVEVVVVAKDVVHTGAAALTEHTADTRGVFER